MLPGTLWSCCIVDWACVVGMIVADCDVTGGMQMASPEVLRVASGACSSLWSGETSPLRTKMIVRRIFLESFQISLPTAWLSDGLITVAKRHYGMPAQTGHQNSEKCRWLRSRCLHQPCVFWSSSCRVCFGPKATDGLHAAGVCHVRSFIIQLVVKSLMRHRAQLLALAKS